uniref:NADH-ubiquinone oxidoreductase chain 5 n=1 Tax=Tityus serrulatus TaxID=6887 RepID=A0A0K1LW71_TITSE|nr:NADH dehydrogenase subunit 5 [Tityus serrulatus]AKU46796.1 NADH dehydrogenase subunit 5 [Tityus serrulatus]
MNFKIWSKTLLITSLFSFLISHKMIQDNISIIFSFSFSSIISTNMEMIIILDYISLLFLSTVLLISSMVIWFSMEYMEEDPSPNRFLILVLLFIFSMLMLILSPNLMSILLGWDGLGLISYCLVIYYQNPRSFNAGMITVLSNRIGDVFILSAIGLSLNFGSWNILSMNLLSKDMIPLFLIMIAAMTKSAQIPFSAWLPEAMAAPTPVSALVHSSTLVTAGVFLMIRFHNTLSSKLSTFLLISSTMTMLMAGLSATLEMDLKKIIALSTLSQLAIMMTALSLNMWKLAYFHMLTHALFKALMFLCAGFVIHSTMNNQDMRKIKIPLFPSPIISMAMMTASITLMGLPFSSAFYSKDMILENTFMEPLNSQLLFLLIISFTFTIMYSFRLTFTIFWSSEQGNKNSFLKETKMMYSPILTLTIFSILAGASLSWIFMDTPLYSPLPLQLKIMSNNIIIMGLLLTICLWILIKSNSLSTNMTINYMMNMWFLSKITSPPILKLLKPLEKSKVLESGWNETSGPQGLHNIIKLNSSYPIMTKESSILLITASILTSFMFLSF